MEIGKVDLLELALDALAPPLSGKAGWRPNLSPRYHPGDGQNGSSEEDDVEENQAAVPPGFGEDRRRDEAFLARCSTQFANAFAAEAEEDQYDRIANHSLSTNQLGCRPSGDTEVSEFSKPNACMPTVLSLLRFQRTTPLTGSASSADRPRRTTAWTVMRHMTTTRRWRMRTASWGKSPCNQRNPPAPPLSADLRSWAPTLGARMRPGRRRATPWRSGSWPRPPLPPRPQAITRPRRGTD